MSPEAATLSPYLLQQLDVVFEQVEAVRGGVGDIVENASQAGLQASFSAVQQRISLVLKQGHHLIQRCMCRMRCPPLTDSILFYSIRAFGPWRSNSDAR